MASMAFATESRLYTYTLYHGIAWCGMVFLAFALLTACSLLAGLTLALGGLDPTLLQLRSVTGKPRQRHQAIVVGKFKSRSTWMLCSLIISSVACGESLPFVIQSLWHGSHQWVPILISTFCMALYAEVLPQYTIPRQPIAWGYYCAPIIWSCMWLTGIVTYPLAYLLDAIAGRSPAHSIFTREEMAAIIKYHDLSENSHGTIGPDATRVMLGALNLDSRSIGGDIALVPERNTSIEKDVEKADLVVLQELIVHWSDVKAVDINDVVDGAFISRANCWSYSCIPVLGKPEFNNVEIDPASVEYRWEGKQLFGFLHIKSLLDVNIRDAIKSSDRRVRVRDIILCPLPIIPIDMPIYDILSVFQLGISRMAVVVPVPPDDSQHPTKTKQNEDRPPRTILWTASDSACTGSSYSGPGDPPSSNDPNTDATSLQEQSISAVMSPKPIGIITYNDIVNAILQKPNLEESDFLHGCNVPPPRKCRKAAGRVKFTCSYVQNRYGAPISRQKSTCSRPSIPPTMRRRKVSGIIPALTNEQKSNETHELGDEITGKQTPKYRSNKIETTCSRSSQLQSVSHTRSSYLSRTESLPSRKALTTVPLGGSIPFWRHVSAAPILPQLQRVTPFSRQSYSGYENSKESRSLSDNEVPSINGESSFLVCSKESEKCLGTAQSAISTVEVFKGITMPEDSMASTRDDSQEAFSLVSWCPAGFVDIEEWNAHLQEPTSQEPALQATQIETSHASVASVEPPVPEDKPEAKPEALPYQGFPAELLTNTRKENRFPTGASSTLPRMTGQMIDLDVFAGKDDKAIPYQEERVHTERNLSGSQKRVMNDSAVLAISGTRSSSFWV